MSTTEKRRMERFPLKFDANLSILHDNRNSTVLKLQTDNICAGGAYLKSGNQLPVGTNVDVDLLMPVGKLINMVNKEAHIKVSGTIIRSGEEGMAILFNESFQISSS